MSKQWIHIDKLLAEKPSLSSLRVPIEETVEAILAMYRRGGKLLLCGNGGSAADCEHISGELLKGFLSDRKLTVEQKVRLTAEGMLPENAARLQQGVSAIPLPSLTAVSTAFSNDVQADLVYAQLVLALGRPEDILLCLSTSGNSKNVVEAAKTAKALGVQTVGMTGATGGKLAGICDILIPAPATQTYLVQEYHLPIYHAICAQVETTLFG